MESTEAPRKNLAARCHIFRVPIRTWEGGYIHHGTKVRPSFRRRAPCRLRPKPPWPMSEGQEVLTARSAREGAIAVNDAA